MLFYEEYHNKEKALIREKFFKTGKCREYIKKRPRGAIE